MDAGNTDTGLVLIINNGADRSQAHAGSEGRTGAGRIGRLAAALLVGVAGTPAALATPTPYYVLDAMGMEAEAAISFPVVGSASTQLPQGQPPLNLTAGIAPLPPSYSGWRVDPNPFASSRGNAQRFAVGIGTVVPGTQQTLSASFTSVIRYQPTTNDPFTVTLKVDPLELFFGFTGDLEGRTPDISDLQLGFDSRFFASYFDAPTFRLIGPNYRSSASITADSGTPLHATAGSSLEDAAGNLLEVFNDASVFADQNSGFASIVMPAVERRLTFPGIPPLFEEPGGNVFDENGDPVPFNPFPSLYLVYEITVFGSIELSGGTTARRPFLFASAGDPIELESGNFRPSIEITPVPLGPALPFMLTGLGALGYLRRRRSPESP
jgi:hypothetical protein